MTQERIVMLRRMLTALLAWAFIAMSQGPAAFAYDAIDVYQEETLHGFKLLVHPKVIEHPDDAEAMRREMAKQLKALMEVIPEAHVARLQTVRIWVEWEAKKDGAAEFHPDERWLLDNGYNPRKVGCVEINNARNFVAWSKRAQPWMVMHELAHAYHNRVLGFDDPAVLQAFKQADNSGKYQQVKRNNGETVRAYALTNHKEYFAEITEAYLGENDFFPFNRDELKAYDPAGFKLMQKVWAPKP